MNDKSIHELMGNLMHGKGINTETRGAKERERMLLDWLAMNVEEEKEIREELRLMLCNTLWIREHLGTYEKAEYAQYNQAEIKRLYELLRGEFKALDPKDYKELCERQSFKERLAAGTKRRGI